MSRPLSFAYWVAPPRLLAGGYPVVFNPGSGQPRLSALLSLGVRAFVDLTHPGDIGPDGRPLEPYASLVGTAAQEVNATAIYERLPIVDETAPDAQSMTRILDRVDLLLNQGNSVYIHCWAGRGRTGTVAGCWLARHGIAEGAGVLATLRRLRQQEGQLDLPCPAEEEQRELVQRWQRGQ